MVARIGWLVTVSAWTLLAGGSMAQPWKIPLEKMHRGPGPVAQVDLRASKYCHTAVYFGCRRLSRLFYFTFGGLSPVLRLPEAACHSGGDRIDLPREVLRCVSSLVVCWS